MISLVKVLGSVFILGVIAAADVSASEAETKVHPGVAHFKAFFATFRGIGRGVFFGTFEVLAD